jgi:hypothetical protein
LKKNYSLKNLNFRTKIAIYLSLSIKDVQAIGEAFNPQKRTSSTSKHEISLLFLFKCRPFLPSWIHNPHPDECGSRSGPSNPN